MRHIYTFFFYLCLPFILLRLLWRSRKNPAYAKRWAERFGYIADVKKNGFWIHAVSVGETLAAIPLVKALQQKYPATPITISTTTPTGAERVTATFKNEEVKHFYLPYDVPRFLQRFLAALQPKLLIIMETELWPNLLQECAKQKIPVLLANARLSEKSARGYKRIGPLTSAMLNHISSIAVQTKTEAERFIALGMPAERITVTGSIKFDLEIPSQLTAEAKQLRNELGASRPVLIAASTHEGEENQILTAFAKIKQQFPQILLVLVPRHPDRFARVNSLCQRQGYSTVLRSEKKACLPETAIFIGDTMGELLLFYAAADVAFVGGSLVATGGHNPLEPAALSLPVIMGPHLFNFAMISEQLQQHQAMKKIHGVEEFTENVIKLFHDEMLRKQMGENGKKFVLQNRGALEKHLKIIESFI